MSSCRHEIIGRSELARRKFRLASAEALVYVKLQIIGSHVVLRSFHYSEDDHHA